MLCLFGLFRFRVLVLRRIVLWLVMLVVIVFGVAVVWLVGVVIVFVKVGCAVCCCFLVCFGSGCGLLLM